MVNFFEDDKYKAYNKNSCLGLESYAMLIDGPSVQNCGNFSLVLGEPLSSLEFLKEDGLMAFRFVWLKVCGGYSKKDSFIVYLNGEEIEVDFDD